MIKLGRGHCEDDVDHGRCHRSRNVIDQQTQDERDQDYVHIKGERLTRATYPDNINEWFNISSKLIVGSITWSVIIISTFIAEFLCISPGDSQ